VQTTTEIDSKNKVSGAAHENARAVLSITGDLAEELHPGQGLAAALRLDSDLDADLGFDSLSRMELVHRVENAFSVTLSDRALGDSETPRDLVREVSTALEQSGGAAPPRHPSNLSTNLSGTQQTPDDAQTLNEVLSWHAEHHHDVPHLHLLGEGETAESLTYGELYASAACLAGGLLGKGLESGDRVLLMLPTGRDYFISFLGTLLAGGVPVPVYPPGQPQQLEEHLRRHATIATNADAVMMITEDEAKRFSQLMVALVPGLRTVTTAAEVSLSSPPDVLPTVSAGDTAFLQYTSGSTGDPKGVILSHDNLLANIRAMGRFLEAGPDDVFVSWLPLYHDMGLIGAWLGSLTFGIPLVIMPPLSFLSRPERWLRSIHDYKGTISGAPNFAYEICATRIRDEDLEGLDLSSWRVAFNGAEAVSPATLDLFADRFEPWGFKRSAIMPVYGLAENSVGVAFPPLGRGPKIDRISRAALQYRSRAEPVRDGTGQNAMAVPACGLPLPGHQIRVVDDTGHELGDRRLGRIQFRGPSSTSGYFRNREATESLFNGEWLNSGDLGYLSEGEIYITGRQKDLIIRAGRNIYPAELETAIGELDGIQRGNVAVFGSPDPETGSDRLVVLAESRRRKKEQQASLLREITTLSIDLAGSAPGDIVLAPPRSVPKTSSGKIRRQAARQLYETGKAGAAGASVQWQLFRIGVTAVGQRLQHSLRHAGAWLYAGWAWLALVLLAIPIWAGVAVLPSLRVRWLFVKTGLAFLRTLTGIGLTVEGREKIDLARPVLLAANHASYLDGPVLISALPTLFGFVVKGELTGHYVPRIFLTRLGCHFVERFDTAKSVGDAAKIADALKDGNNLAYFPEGTFTRMPGLLPFHMGAFTTAVETGTPIQPIAIRGTRAILRDDTGFPRRGKIQVKILDPITPSEDAETPWQAALQLRDAVRRAFLTQIAEPDLAHERVFHELAEMQKEAEEGGS